MLTADVDLEDAIVRVTRCLGRFDLFKDFDAIKYIINRVKSAINGG